MARRQRRVEGEEIRPSGPPPFIASYCPFIILLLSFFVAMVSFAQANQKEQATNFARVKVSFAQMLSGFGLKQVTTISRPTPPAPERGMGHKPLRGTTNQRPARPEGPSDIAGSEFKQLADNGMVQVAEDGRETSLICGFRFEAGKGRIGDERRASLEAFAGAIASVLPRSKLVVSIGALYPEPGQAGDEGEVALRSLGVAEDIRAQVLQKVVPRKAQEQVSRRIYSYCRRATASDVRNVAEAKAADGVLRIGVSEPRSHQEKAGSQE